MVLFGDMFNPWFTAFSYLKGAVLKIISAVAAGTVIVLIEQVFAFTPAAASHIGRNRVLFAAAAVLGFLPFYALGRYPEVKSVVLQFHELTRVDTAFARELVNPLGLGRWVHLGQRPPLNDDPHPWPQPWRLGKSNPSLLPEDFNLVETGLFCGAGSVAAV